MQRIERIRWIPGFDRFRTIATGGSVAGWVLFELPGTPLYYVIPGTAFELSFKEVNNKVYTLQTYVPGVQAPSPQGGNFLPVARHILHVLWEARAQSPIELFAQVSVLSTD